MKKRGRGVKKERESRLRKEYKRLKKKPKERREI